MSLSIRSLVLLPVALLALASAVRAADPVPTRFYDAAARQMASSLQAGEGWCVVSARDRINLVPGTPAVDCVRYQVVTSYQSGMVNDQFYVEVTYGAATPWISTEFGMPKTSVSSLTAAKQANAAVGLLDEALGLLAPAVAAEPDAAVRALGQQMLNALNGQRAALVDLISKDVAAVGSSMK